MFFSILVLSVVAPGVAGAGLICLSILLKHLGVLLEAVAIVMEMDPLLTMLLVGGNYMGTPPIL